MSQMVKNPGSRGRPPLDLPMARILEAIKARRRVTAAAADLRCSPAYIHARLKAAGLTLGQVLGSGVAPSNLRGN